MNIEKIRLEISKYKGKEVFLKINIGRNRYENIIGVVQDTYPYLFTVKVNGDVKAFSYVDVLTKNVILTQ